MEEKRLFALRGATQCLNEAEDIQNQVLQMYDELLSKNNLTEDALVSVIFSVTSDLNAKNPASALRQKGRALNTALFVTREAQFQGSMEQVIRVIIHCYLEKNAIPIHVYRNGAELLRPDLQDISNNAQSNQI